ncbi:MAG: class I SAM-dependent methyltransferase [Gammaproteobacteria bacterium]|nr:class I SAM-dependent methyltransferase [Gammaproteobacteria bacterium]
MVMSEYYRRTTCRLCTSPDLTQVLALTPTPPANAFVDATKLAEEQRCYPLDVHFCEACGHVQLVDVVDARVLFENYVYVSSTSPVFVKHFEDYAENLISQFDIPEGALVCDIGSNDGVFLRAFKDRGMRVLGVDPAKDIAKRATASGIPTIPQFFSQPIATTIAAEHGRAAAVTANNVFAHADDLSEIVSGVCQLLDEDGVFVFEVSYLLDVYRDTLFDTIYHEHVAYHTVEPLQRFFAQHAMVLLDAQRISPHGGSLRAVAGRANSKRVPNESVAQLIALEREAGLHRAQTFQDWAAKIQQRGRELRAELDARRQRGQRIAGFGAPAKATTLMYHYGLDADVFEFIIDDSPLKQGLFSPGLHVPVLPFSALDENDIDCLVILAWNFAEPIIAKCQAFIEAGGSVVVPLPEVRVVEGAQTMPATSRRA